MAGSQVSIDFVTPTPLMVVDGALDVLQTPNKWTKGRFAQDAGGEGCDPCCVEAEKFCMIGALRKASGFSHNYLVLRILPVVRRVIGTENVAEWNDTHTYEEVIGALKQTKEELANV